MSFLGDEQMSFKLWSIDGPKYFEQVLPLFQTGICLTNIELVQLTEDILLSSSVRSIGHLAQFWFVLGVLDRTKDPRRGYKYSLSEFGKSTLQSLQFNTSLAVDLLHWTIHSTWWRSPEFVRGWSWLYQEACDTMWEDSPKEVIPKKLLSDMSERANSQFQSGASPTFSIQSIRTVMRWLSALEPPFLTKKEETNRGSPWLSHRRESCSPELLFLALQIQYRVKDLPFGTSLLMDDDLVETVCKTCLLAPERFWPMVELCSLTFPALTRKETSYGTSLMIAEAAPFTPPEPRALATSSRQDSR